MIVSVLVGVLLVSSNGARSGFRIQLWRSTSIASPFPASSCMVRVEIRHIADSYRPSEVYPAITSKERDAQHFLRSTSRHCQGHPSMMMTNLPACSQAESVRSCIDSCILIELFED